MEKKTIHEIDDEKTLAGGVFHTKEVIARYV
jgi:hypothetical protein